MAKEEFDRISTAAGFGPCADYMWPEIEEVYSTSDLIDKDIVVDIYWHEPGIHREILALRRELARLGARAGEIKCYGYSGFNEMWEIAGKMGKLNDRFGAVMSEARARKSRREDATQKRTEGE